MYTFENLFLDLEKLREVGNNTHISNINQAVKFTNIVFNYNLPAPKCMLLTQGDIALYWRNFNNYIEIGFYEGNKLYFYALDRDNNEIGKDSHDIPENYFDPELIELFNNFL